MEAKKAVSNKKTEKGLGLLDLFFISFGGQAPIISLLTFGTVMISEVHTAGAFAMLIATFVVLFNGLVVYFLANRFRRGGGYYVYAYYGLTSRMGLETGWIYLLYALSYGGTLLSGGAYVLYAITGFNQALLALVISALASAIVIAGVKVSSKYAMVMSIVEMAALGLLSVYFLFVSHWHFYDPVKFSPNLPEAVLFGLGIPTGYGSIAPLGGEAKSSDIGKASILVLLVGGGLATLFFFSLGAIDFTGNLVEFLLGSFGLGGLVVMAFISLNDGTLGGVSYILANSRTIKAMAEDGIFPRVLAKEVKGKPLMAELFVSVIFISVLTLMTKYFGIYDTFVTLGALAGLSNIFIHSSADLSLIRLASKRLVKHVIEVTVGAIATLISLAVFVGSLVSGVSPYIENMMFGWIILGFFYAEALDVVRSGPEEEKRGSEAQ
ncbi:MAG: APC family permease [Candidatus Aramenus sp.]|nr:APC family permease [Candidatus Aramenus sp.]